MDYINRIINTLILILIFFQCGKINAQNLELKLDIDTNTFLEAQSIWATVVLKNTGKDTAILQPFIMTEDHNGMRFDLRDADNNKMKYSTSMISDDFGMTPNLMISPGDSLSEIYEITSFFSNSEYKNAPIYISTLHCLVTGKYSLQAYAFTTYTFTRKDTIFSNKVEFKIIKPEGAELKALQTLRSIELERLNIFDEVTINKYEKFINDFPKSIYTPQAYSNPIFLLIYSPFHDINKAKKLILDLIIKFPNYGCAVDNLDNFFYRSTSKEKDSLNNLIIRKHPNTKVAKQWERLVNEQKNKSK